MEGALDLFLKRAKLGIKFLVWFMSKIGIKIHVFEKDWGAKGGGEINLGLTFD